MEGSSAPYDVAFWRHAGFSQPAHEAFIRNWLDKIETIWPTESDDRSQIQIIWGPGIKQDESKMSEAGRKKRREARELINGTGLVFIWDNTSIMQC